MDARNRRLTELYNHDRKLSDVEIEMRSGGDSGQ